MPIYWKAAFAAPLLASAQLPPEPQYVENPYVHQVTCANKRGTAFMVGKNSVLSVAHVTTAEGCTLKGESFTVLWQGSGDFSALRAPQLGEGGFKISCEGFKRGQHYRALGYAKGLPVIRAIDVIATGQSNRDGLAIMFGDEAYIPGMSGGPVISDAGEVVGTVNAYYVGTNYSLSRSLADTPMCERAK